MNNPKGTVLATRGWEGQPAMLSFETENVWVRLADAELAQTVYQRMMTTLRLPQIDLAEVREKWIPRIARATTQRRWHGWRQGPNR